MAVNNKVTSKNPRQMLGYKFFREDSDGEFKIIRVVKTYNDGKVAVINSDEKVTKSISLKELSALGYTPLQSIGVVSFSIVKVGNNSDVIVTLLKRTDAMMGLSVPCVICRQSCTDFFYNLLANVEEHGYVGVSVSDRTCPTNIEYGQLLACDDILFSQMVNIYYDDTIDSVLQCISTLRFNSVLDELYTRHINTMNDPKLKLKDEDHGWCRSLKKLLTINNFWTDVGQAFGITDVDFEIPNYIIEKKDENDQEYQSFGKDVIDFLSSTFQINIVDCIVTKYFYDIDFGEYHNSNYVLLRDSKDDLYLVVYTIGGEYFESDLQAQEEKKHLAHSLGLRIVSKYKE